MKMFLISDNTEARTGLRLAGVDGVIVHTDREFDDALKAAMNDPDIGIILISKHLHDLHSEKIVNLKLSVRLPLIVSIPDRGDTDSSTEAITKYIGSAVGIKL